MAKRDAVQPGVDPRVDAYIAKSSPVARPILEHLRTMVHKGCPGVQETIKWGAPHFEFHGMLCGMAGFKAHCAFGFWNRALELPTKRDAMGQFGRITALTDLPADRVLLRYVREAARLNEAGIKTGVVRKKRAPLPMPDDLAARLRRHRKASAAFDAFSPSQQREYIEWITEAKTDATRQKRLDTALEWIAEGKGRNWKYERSRG